MPTSNIMCAGAWLHLIHLCEPATVLDIGPGMGKAGQLIREYVGEPPRGPVCRIDAIEAHEPYVTERLKCLYDNVVIGDATTFAAGFFDGYDCVVMIDVIEHLTKDQGMDLLSRIRKNVVICTPAEWMQNPEKITWENHRSLWTLEDFQATGRLETDLSQFGGIIVRLGRV